MKMVETVDIENKIDGPTSNLSKDGLENVSLDKKFKLNSKTLVVEPNVDQNQEAGRKRVEARAKSKIVGRTFLVRKFLVRKFCRGLVWRRGW